MGESLIVRKGGSSSNGPKVNKVFKTELIQGNIKWNVPAGLINNTISVRIFGGGSSGWVNAYTNYGGNGGAMNNAIFTNMIPGTQIQINIGRGGISKGYEKDINMGGTTIFGSYLSANGGQGSGGCGQSAEQFGGGGAAMWGSSSQGGRGGKWGGGGGGGYATGFSTGGSGGEYGGGGGGGTSACGMGGQQSLIYCNGGNGGYYGGGGGGGGAFNRPYIGSYAIGYGGNGGWYNSGFEWQKSGLGGDGGNGGTACYNRRWNSWTFQYNSSRGSDGTNTSSWTNVYYDEENKVYFRGTGLGKGYNSNGLNCTTRGGGGGGGFGGNGGDAGFYDASYVDDEGDTCTMIHATGGGGGGYGSNGGNGGKWGGGGGGGFGGDGGKGGSESNTQILGSTGGGGGGGYGKPAKGGTNGGGGGGYYAAGGSMCGGGGGYGASGTGGTNNGDGGIAAGGSFYGNGGDGICIIQYYCWDIEF